MDKVYIHIVEMKGLEGIPVVSAFSSYENLTKFEDSIRDRKDIKVLNVSSCEIDKRIEELDKEEIK